MPARPRSRGGAGRRPFAVHTVTVLTVAALAAAGLAAIPLAAAPAAAAAEPATLVGHWTFDEGTGTTAADSAGEHPATLSGAASWAAGLRGPSALVTDGGSGFADTGATVIDTSQSFSIAAWVKLDRISGYQTVVSVDGDQVSGFYFGLRDDTRRFAFVKLPADQATGAPSFPSATFDPAAGQWYHLTGVHDAVAGTLALYVNGRLEATTPAPAEWRAAGNLVIGRARFGGNPVDFVDGMIDDVRVYTGTLTAADAARFATVGSWRFDEGTGTTAADDSLDGTAATLTGGVTWTAGVSGPFAAQFDGVSGFADVPASVVDTSQSFSVAAWARLDVATGFRTAVSVDGDQVSGFYLQRRDDGRWAFTRIGSDAGGAGVVAGSTTAAQVGQWYHLVGVYDRVAGTVTLYVNGTRQQSVAFGTPWRATGHLVIGRGKFGGNPVDFFPGAVDDVRTFPFPLAPADAAALAVSGLWHFDEGAGTLAADASTNRADGTLRGAGWTAGAAGRAVSFDGTADVTVGDSPGLDLGTSAGSVAAWFRTSAAGFQPVVAKGATGPDEPGYWLAVNAGAVTARIGAGAARIEIATTGAGYADGGWHHAAAVLDRRTQRLVLYVDGEPVPIAPVAGSCGVAAGATALNVTGCPDASADSAAPFTVGAASDGATRLTGAVDEVQVVRFPLTAEQVAVLAGSNVLTVNAADIRATTRSTTYGAFLEDISHSGDGGLYAELVRNRTFKETFQGPVGGGGPVPYWSLVTGGGATGEFAIDPSQPLNAAIDRSLRVHVGSLPPGGRVAVANVGYYGVAVAPSTTYRGSFWAKATPGFTGRARVSLEKPDGTVLASALVSGIGADWAERRYTLRTPAGIPVSTDNRIVVALEPACARPDCAVSNADVWLSVVSLFPPTWKNRPNGLRRDIAAKIADMKPGFFRVPGGNYLEGSTIATRFDWRTTLGPISQRPGHQNTAWGYWSTDGLGLLEYLQLAEDVGAQPMLAVYAGYSLNGSRVPEAEFDWVVQDALDEIEYAIGDTSTTWGARRAADGHPAPFNLHYVEVGNEDWFDGSGSYAFRFTTLYDAIKAQYPQLEVIATTGGYQGGAATTTPTGRTPDLFDDHYYQPPSWFADNARRYDTADRSRPQVLVGEYGALDGSPTGSLRAAVGEAAFLTGLERNSDIVIGSTYAPLIVHENAPNWPTNLIGIDADSSYGSPSYWVQQMFSTNLGQQVVGTRLAGAGGLAQVVTKTTRAGRTTFFVKIVNSTSQLQSARLSFQGIARIDGTATRTELTGDPSTRNTLANPTAVAPTMREVTGITANTRFTFPPSSVTVLRITGGI